MGHFKLRGFGVSTPGRIGDLLAKTRDGSATQAEQVELLDLLKQSRRISENNIRRLIELRGDPTPTPAPEPAPAPAPTPAPKPKRKSKTKPKPKPAPAKAPKPAPRQAKRASTTRAPSKPVKR